MRSTTRGSKPKFCPSFEVFPDNASPEILSITRFHFAFAGVVSHSSSLMFLFLFILLLMLLFLFFEEREVASLPFVVFPSSSSSESLVAFLFFDIKVELMLLKLLLFAVVLKAPKTPPPKFCELNVVRRRPSSSASPLVSKTPPPL